MADGARRLLIAVACAALAAPSAPLAQSVRERLPRAAFDVIPPSERVGGDRGSFRVVQPACRVGPLGPHTRRRIVDIAVQEWAVFGFQTLDMVSREERLLPSTGAFRIVPDALNPAFDPTGRPRLARRTLKLGRWEDEREVLATVAGYWSATPDGGEVLRKQNRAWKSWFGEDVGWIEPWSAAFVSWVMCEAGLGERETFRRSIAHWEYVDQAIDERDRPGSGAYEAHDLGEAAVAPGDLLCNARGEARYRTLADRRPDIGRYAPLHCDIVVKLDPQAGVIFTIGGNVLNSVSLAAVATDLSSPTPRPLGEDALGGARRWFAHLKLKTDPIEADALDASPTIRALQPR